MAKQLSNMRCRSKFSAAQVQEWQRNFPHVQLTARSRGGLHPNLEGEGISNNVVSKCEPSKGDLHPRSNDDSSRLQSKAVARCGWIRKGKNNKTAVLTASEILALKSSRYRVVCTVQHSGEMKRGPIRSSFEEAQKDLDFLHQSKSLAGLEQRMRQVNFGFWKTSRIYCRRCLSSHKIHQALGQACFLERWKAWVNAKRFVPETREMLLEPPSLLFYLFVF